MNPQLDEMLSLAKAAALNAYCPYSNFRVGACLRAVDGALFAGCNVENASFGLTICAERNAAFAAIAAGVRAFDSIVIFTPTEAPFTPCGACRQVIREFCSDDLKVYSFGNSTDILVVHAIVDLLPDSFGIDQLKR